MKKGCFIALLIILTVLIAGTIYFVKNHGNDVVQIFKPMILGTIKNEITEKIDKAEKSVYSDSLKSMFNNFISELRNRKEADLNKADDFFNGIRFALSDGKLDSLEISSLTKQMKINLDEHERSKKN